MEILDTDEYFKVVRCNITPLADWPVPDAFLTKLDPGTYIVGRDIGAGTYRGQAESDDSCYWERLKGVSGTFSDIIANGIEEGQFFVTVYESDFALTTRCPLSR